MADHATTSTKVTPRQQLVVLQLDTHSLMLLSYTSLISYVRASPVPNVMSWKVWHSERLRISTALNRVGYTAVTILHHFDICIVLFKLTHTVQLIQALARDTPLPVEVVCGV
jgi:hypothetical protein